MEQSDARARVLISVDELRQGIGGTDLPQLLDVRWRLGEPVGAGLERYREGHLPGARFLDLEAVLTGPHADPLQGRHPLPSPEQVADGLAELGIDPDREIVVYDEPGSFAAGRAWWVLRWLGLDVRVLDGGITAWLAAIEEPPTTTPEPPTTIPDDKVSGASADETAGVLTRGAVATLGTEPVEGSGPGFDQHSHRSGPLLETGEPAPAEPTQVGPLAPGHLPTLTADEVAEFDGLLIDVRAPERYRGEVEPLDPKAGHIPGAVNRPVGAFWEADGTLPAPDRLRELFALADGEPVAVYCGSGVSAAQELLALASIGIEAALYPPSWSGWSSDPDRPVAVGE